MKIRSFVVGAVLVSVVAFWLGCTSHRQATPKTATGIMTDPEFKDSSTVTGIKNDSQFGK